jgi:hypothetical protein
MSRPAAATQQKPEPRIRRARFAEEDLVSTFGEPMLAEARRLVGAGAVDLTTTGPAIEATIVADGEHRRVALNPTQTGRRVAFLGTCEPLATDMVDLRPPRHIPTLPDLAVATSRWQGRLRGNSRQIGDRALATDTRRQCRPVGRCCVGC